MYSDYCWRGRPRRLASMNSRARLPMTNPPKRRWHQFSLRTLLIVVTLLAAECAFVTWFLRDRQRLIRERDDALQKQQQLEAELQKRLTTYGFEVVTVNHPALSHPPAAIETPSGD